MYKFVFRKGRGVLLPAIFLGFLVCVTSCAPMLDLDMRDTSNLSVPQLIHLRSNAIDPLKKWRTASSYLLRTSLASSDENNKIYYSQEVLYKEPKRFKMTTFKNGKPESIIICNEGRIWKVDPTTNRSVLLNPDALEYKLITMTTRMSDPTLEYSDIFPRISVDMFTKDGKRFYRLICHPHLKEIAPYIFYINGETFLTEKLETIQYQTGTPFGLFYSCETMKYITVNDIKVAQETLVTITAGDDDPLVTRRGSLEKMQINIDIKEAEFLPPIPFTHSGKRAALPSGKNTRK